MTQAEALIFLECQSMPQSHDELTEHLENLIHKIAHEVIRMNPVVQLLEKRRQKVLKIAEATSVFQNIESAKISLAPVDNFTVFASIGLCITQYEKKVSANNLLVANAQTPEVLALAIEQRIYIQKHFENAIYSFALIAPIADWLNQENLHLDVKQSETANSRNLWKAAAFLRILDIPLPYSPNLIEALKPKLHAPEALSLLKEWLRIERIYRNQLG